MSQSESLVRALHHRTRNSFQIISSLVSLLRRTPPAIPRTRDDLRFLEEHINALASAHRLADLPRDTVFANDLIRAVVQSLRQIAGTESNLVVLSLDEAGQRLGLDQAIGLALYLAVALPPCLDLAVSMGVPVRIVALPEARSLSVSVGGDWPAPMQPDGLRRRLSDAYIRRLNGVLLDDGIPGTFRIRIPVDRAETVAEPPRGL